MKRCLRESFAKGGWQGFLRAITAKEQLAKLSRYESIIFHTALGEKDQALAELSESYEVFGPLLRIEPLLDPRRDDPALQKSSVAPDSRRNSRVQHRVMC